MRSFICTFSLVIACLADEADDILNAANTRFTALLLTESEKQNGISDIVISGFSVLQPLAQIGLASNGSTRDELLKVAGFAENDVEKVYPNVNTNLQSVDGIELKIASRVYVGQLQLNEKFKDVSKQMFGSEFKNLDFNNPTAAAQEINSWVEELTNNKIKNLVDPQSLKNPNEETVAVLVNAIYFKGKFRWQFPEDATMKQDFYVNKNTIIKTPTMYQKNTFKYVGSNALDAKIIGLDYESEESSLFIILPNDIEGLPKLLNQLKQDPILLAEATAIEGGQEIELYLPKFKIETTSDLKSALQNLGVKEIFMSTKKNNFRNLLGTGSEKFLSVSQAIQKAFIEVNEEGTEAAAVNAFRPALDLPMFKLPPPVVRVDHPFYFAVKVKNTVIFSGVVKFNSIRGDTGLFGKTKLI